MNLKKFTSIILVGAIGAVWLLKGWEPSMSEFPDYNDNINKHF